MYLFSIHKFNMKIKLRPIYVYNFYQKKVKVNSLG